MMKYYLTLQKFETNRKINIGYVEINICKPFDKEFTKDDIHDIINDSIDYSIGVFKIKEI